MNTLRNSAAVCSLLAGIAPACAFEAATVPALQGGNVVACANAIPGTRVLGEHPVVRSTGQCLIGQERAKVTEDDGFHVRYHEHIELRLQLPGAKAG